MSDAGNSADRLDARTCWVLAGLGVLFLLTYALPYWVKGYEPYMRLVTRIVIIAAATLWTVWKDTMTDEGGSNISRGADRTDR